MIKAAHFLQPAIAFLTAALPLNVSSAQVCAGPLDLGTLGGCKAEATGVSADGSVVVGFGRAANGAPRALRWSPSTGVQGLDGFANAVSFAAGVSADGETVVGAAGPGGAFRWTQSAGLQFVFPNSGLGDSLAQDVSADGSVAVGMVLMFMGVRRTFRVEYSPLGSVYCRPSPESSTGCGGALSAKGDPRLATGSLELTAARLPQHSLGVFLTSQTQGYSINAGGDQGTLCLSGSIGRFVNPGQVMSSGTSDSFTLSVDLAALPAPTGTVAAQAGETWNFQAWHQDVNPTATSNLTDAVSVTFY